MSNIIPCHIAFIMDGNGRWAKKRMLTRKAGHREGVKALERVVDALEIKGVKYATFYAFSTENWRRPKYEVDSLFELIRTFVNKELPKYAKRNFKVIFIGDLKGLPEAVRQDIDKVSELMVNNDGLNIIIALNYGSRDEIVAAVNSIINSGETNISVEQFNNHLYTAMIPDPDIIVRSSGEKRLSNFMLYQSAYSELIFVEDLWPDFNANTIDNIINEYKQRNRRYGGI